MVKASCSESIHWIFNIRYIFDYQDIFLARYYMKKNTTTLKYSKKGKVFRNIPKKKDDCFFEFSYTNSNNFHKI